MHAKSVRTTADDRLYWIDALRGYAILGVVIVHSGLMFPESSGATTRFGMMGVDLFFVVSAFTIALSWHSRAEPLLSFYVRRLFRIAPMFWVALVVYVVLSKNGLPVLGEHRHIRFWQIALTAAMSHGLHPDTVNYVVPGDWSISVELSFYLIFPVLMAVITTRDRAAALLFLTVACQASGLLTASPGLEPRLQEMWNLSLPSHFVAFAFGLYVFLSFREQVESSERDRSAEALLVAATALLLVMCTREWPSVLAYSTTFGVIALGMAKGAGKWLCFPLVRRLGQVSFSVYLLHFCMIDLLAWMIRQAVPHLAGQFKFAILLSGVLTLAMGVCSLTYRFVELPGIRMGKRIADRLSAGARSRNRLDGMEPETAAVAPPLVQRS
jgi:exopolysaccharide production protein ExoZ